MDTAFLSRERRYGDRRYDHLSAFFRMETALLSRERRYGDRRYDHLSAFSAWTQRCYPGNGGTATAATISLASDFFLL